VLLSQNRTLHRADLQADAAVNADVGVNPIEGSPALVRAPSGVNASHRAGIDAVRDPFAALADNGVGHH